MIRLRHIGLPPSANHAYVNLPRGGRMLSKEGKKYKAETTAYLVRSFRTELLKAKKNAPYLAVVRFYFTDVENKGYPEKASTRYKKIDLSNRLKLLEDVLKDVLGVDDSQNLVIVLLKEQAATELVDIWLWDLEREATPFDAALGSLS